MALTKEERDLVLREAKYFGRGHWGAYVGEGDEDQVEEEDDREYHL